MTDTQKPADEQSRTIVLIYGALESGTPFWVFAAVRPAKYQAMTTAQQKGELDLYHFEPYGEIIVSGEGKSPPDAVTLKVAEMYQTDSGHLGDGEEVAE
ncbi:MAG: hypothetical protein EBR02_07610 [Alphaproteobacteria bacterium]|nr:hypothetical protein [Alphaproteobacteria bacterium]